MREIDILFGVVGLLIGFYGILFVIHELIQNRRRPAYGPGYGQVLKHIHYPINPPEAYDEMQKGETIELVPKYKYSDPIQYAIIEGKVVKFKAHKQKWAKDMSKEEFEDWHLSVDSLFKKVPDHEKPREARKAK